LVTLVNLVNPSCKECYDVSEPRASLERVGMVFGNVSTYETNSTKGKQLLQQYNITLVPTIILSPEAGAYPFIQQIWGSVGTQENDSWYVFRKLEALQGMSYYDMTAGKVLNGTGSTG
jgi:hypothetical protein